MKPKHLLCLLLLTAGCATQNKKSAFIPDKPAPIAEYKEQSLSSKPKLQGPHYIGVVGYLNRPPVLADEKSIEVYERCEPLEITSLQEKDGAVFVYAKQKGNIIIFAGINRQKFKMDKYKRLNLLDRHFVKRLDIVGVPRHPADISNKLCLGQTWAGMAKKEFLFLYGEPEKRNIQKTVQGSFDVWSYTGIANEYRHYYFREQKLYSWTQ